MTLTLKVTVTKNLSYKNANISEARLDTHIVTVIYRQQFVYALSFGPLTLNLG